MVIGNMINSSVRSVKGKVEFFLDSTLAYTFLATDKLISFEVERVAEEGKFFGYGYCQKAIVKLIDVERQVNISTANSFRIGLTTDSEFITPYPTFFVQ